MDAPNPPSTLYDAGSIVREITQKLCLGRRRVWRRVRDIELLERDAMAPTSARLFRGVPGTKPPNGRPRYATCSPTYAVAATRVHTHPARFLAHGESPCQN
jgi:hypothetical protein